MIPSPDAARARSRWIAAGVTAVSAIVAMCCATRERSPAAPTAASSMAAPTTAPVASSAPPAESAVTAAAASASAPTGAGGSSSPALAEGLDQDRTKLPIFYAALRGLETKSRTKHVRVLWYGDSHAAADFWTGVLRNSLQKRFGSGGVGYVYAGYKEYRHDHVKIGIDGKWGMRPKKPATSVPSTDGKFGLGGVMLHGSVDGPRTTLTVTDSDPAKLSWDVCYRLDKPGDEITIAIGGGAPKTMKASAAEPAGAIRHFVVSSDASASLALTPTAGRPELCGVVVEGDPSSAPGVVLDTLGVNGAKFATMLAWDEPSWAAELARRDPDLVILQYGTNEATDVGAKPTTFGRYLSQVVARLRRVKPEVDCLVVGPTDRADREDVVPGIRDTLREASRSAGCGFWDTLGVMGGRGAIRAWRDESPPRAARDGIHLTPKGYHDLGERLFADLMKGYGASR